MAADSATIRKNKKNSIFLASSMLKQLRENNGYLVYEPDERQMYIYKKPIYHPIDDVAIDQYIYKFLVEHDITDVWSTSRIAEIRRAMVVCDLCEHVKLNDYNNKLCLNNGVYDFDERRLIEHSHNFYFSEIINVSYNEDAKSPVEFLTFLNKSFQLPGPDGAIDTESVEACQQIGGYLLFPKNLMEKMFVFLGHGANGKSLLLYAYSLFFDKKNVSYLSLEDLSSNTLERDALLNSRINISTESKGASVDAEEIKKIISGEGIQVRRKYQKAISFHPRTKIIVASNSRPYFNDTSGGMARRLYFLTFKNKFLTQQEYDMAHKNNEVVNNRFFLADDKERLMKAFIEEKEGILLFFLRGLKKLKDNKFQIIEGENAQLTKDDYNSSNDMVGTWLRNNYTVDYSENGWLYTATELLAEYRYWYAENVNTKSLNFSAASMSARVKEIFFLEHKRLTRNGKQQFGFTLMKKDEGLQIGPGNPADVSF